MEGHTMGRDTTVPARYRRVGEVWAWQLQKPREWQTDNGDVLRGKPGDWWVVSPDSAFRTVAASVFADDYAHVAEQVYRRRGEVTARQVVEKEQVDSLEGVSTALPGDWIVIDDVGNSWAVPDAVFRRGYTAV